MTYKIAVASSNGTDVDTNFGSARFFSVYTVSDEGNFVHSETRAAPDENQDKENFSVHTEKKCTGNGCTNSGNCCRSAEISEKVRLISDCRCVVASKIGFTVQKQLERKAIAAFDVQCKVQEALQKITKYFYSVDNHLSLAKK